MLGKMSVAVRSTARPPNRTITIASTTKVSGRFKATRTMAFNREPPLAALCREGVSAPVSRRRVAKAWRAVFPSRRAALKEISF